MVTKTRGGTASRPATRKTTKKTTKKAPARARRPEPTRPPFWRRQARDLWAVGLITLGVLLFLALWGKQLGPVGRGLDTGLALVAGWVRMLLPFVALGAGAALLFDRPRGDDDYDDEDEDEDHEGADPWRLAVGSVLGVLGICGLAELAKGSPRFSNSTALKDAGGFLGAAVGRPLHAGIGSAGAGVLLVAVIFVAILVATGVSLATAGHALGSAARNVGRTFSALWQGKPFVITSDLGADAPEEDSSSRRLPFDAEADALPADEEEFEEEEEDRRSTTSTTSTSPIPCRWPWRRSRCRSRRRRRGPRASGRCRPCPCCRRRRRCARTSARSTPSATTWCVRWRHTVSRPGWWAAGSGPP